MRIRLKLTTLVVTATCLMPGSQTWAADGSEGSLSFTVKVDVARQELNPGFCWFHPRVAAVPAAGKDGNPAVIMTIQRHLKVSDYYSGIWTMRTDDLGKTWSAPLEIPELAWVRQPGEIVVAVADVTPGWHQPSGKLLAIGCSVRYGPKGKQLSDVKRPSQTAYAVHDPKTGEWSRWQTLEMPPDDKFNFARNGCAQWIVKPDGNLLIPIYYAKSAGVPASVTVVHCRFDGQKITYLENGTEFSLDVVRGLCEPSLIQHAGRYYLTIRNDLKAYVTAGDDGLNFLPIKPWTFDDGQELGSYNTQQHWLGHTGGLFLTYTRKGAGNDHIFRHRAPLFIAQVDPERLCVLRHTEKILIPERGAQMGNFGAAPICRNESWVTVSEYMKDNQPLAGGADGSTFVSRVIWSNPNQELP